MVLDSDQLVIIPPPSAIEELKAWLKTEGFTLVEQEDSPLFGDRRFRWARDDIRLQVALDRGRWFVDLIPGWMEGWMGFGLEIVVDTMADNGRFTHLFTLAESVEILKAVLPEMSDLLATEEGCDIVREMSRERAHRWFGS